MLGVMRVRSYIRCLVLYELYQMLGVMRVRSYMRCLVL